MTIRELICSAGVNTLGEFLCLERGSGAINRFISGLVIHEGKKEYEVKSSKIEYNIKSENKKYKIVLDDDDTAIKGTQKENIITRG